MEFSAVNVATVCMWMALVVYLFMAWRAHRHARFFREGAIMTQSSEKVIALAISAARLGVLVYLDNAGDRFKHEHVKVLQHFREADRAAVRQLFRVERAMAESGTEHSKT